MNSSKEPKRIVIVGAGPAGLLAAILLLRRNKEPAETKYHVHLIDPGVDYGKLDEEGLKRFRSWMIGLSCHGLDAIKSVPGLYEEYVYKLGINITKGTFAIGTLIQFSFDFTEEDGFTVDRNYICGALARYLNEHFASPQFTSQYETTALYVDADTKHVYCRSTVEGASKEMTPVPYDIVLGCDGIRSVVRNAFLSNHRDFEFDLKGSFGIGKSVHLPLPDDLEEGRFLFLANCCPNLSAFVLPERDQMINAACGYNLNNPCDKELFSVDSIVISDYFRKHFTTFHMDYDEMGKEWVKQPWSTLQMVHANFYHSIKIQALLLGDAAHATGSNIGQGMNTALADAKALNKLLDEHKDDWDKVLPAFSKERVKEGNALTDLSFHSFSLSSSMQFSILIRQNVRRLANKVFPSWLVEPEPMLEVTRGMKLSEAYDKMIQLGYLQKSRQINNDIMQDYFEETTGMVKERRESSRLWKSLLVIGITSGAYYYAKKK